MSPFVDHHAIRPRVARADELAVYAGAADLSTGEEQQALVILIAGRAAVEMGPHARHPRLGVLAGELEVDVAVEFVEALLAAQLGFG
jgi:hypothetical protein